MLNSLRDAERYLDGLVNLERRASFDYEKLGLARIRALLVALGEPQAGLPCVHVAGSKGKGSVTLAVEQLLSAAGLRVGSFTSPHLESWRERFRVAGQTVTATELVAALQRAQPAIDELRADPRLRPSFFDACTALALALFRDSGVDVGAIEVGLGGRLDSTNAVESRVSVITSIQLEHTDKLGDTLAEIAAEKAGIARAETPLVCGPLPPDAQKAVRARCAAVDAPLLEVGRPAHHQSEAELRVQLEDGRELRAPVLGSHQALNLALAVRASEIFVGRELDAAELRALETLELPARIERFGDVILDSAHSPDSARELRRVLAELWPDRRWVLGLCMSRDKDAAGVLEELAGLTRICVTCAAEPVRSRDPVELAEMAARAGIERVEPRADPREALALARSLARPGDLIVLTGSVYFAGAVRGALVARGGR